MTEVILLTGSNLGDRLAKLIEARTRIGAAIGPLQRTSGIYETAPWGLDDQPAFLNQVLVTRTNLLPEQVLDQILSIEEDMGRKRTTKWGPREIDIDILFYGDTVIDMDRLKVPHPEIPNRRFVLEPLAEIAPAFLHPVLGLSMADLLAGTSDRLTVRPWKEV
jgi:2-amino-4-hydroxy-6-hydroxymethyldihydropteridine diphosphokinase